MAERNKSPTYLYDFVQKDRTAKMFARYMLDRLCAMMQWDGLPDTIPPKIIERILLTRGDCYIAEVQGDLYALSGEAGGEPGPYLLPTKYTVADPGLNVNKTYTINEDGVWVWNDTLREGIDWILKYYLSLLTEADLSIRVALINSRIPMILTADKNQQAQAARSYLADVESGKLAAITCSDWQESLKTLPYSTAGASSQLVPLIELRQHIWATMLTELGIPAVSNGKREALNSTETDTASGILRPLVDDMLECRQQAAELMNKMYGLNVTVSLGSIWEEERSNPDPQTDNQEVIADNEPENNL